MRKEFFTDNSFATIEQMQAALDSWVVDYNNEREHQSLGDVPPIRRFELAKPASLEVIDGDVAVEEELPPRPKVVTRRVDRVGRISILKHRYHVGRHLTGEAVTIESSDGLLHVSHNGAVVATHARRHLIDDDDKMDRRPKAARPAQPTTGGEVLRIVDPHGSISFAGTAYRVGNRYRRQSVGVRLVGDTVQISSLTEHFCGRIVLATTARRSSEPWHSPTASRGRSVMVGHSYRSQNGTRVVRLHSAAERPSSSTRRASSSPTESNRCPYLSSVITTLSSVITTELWPSMS